MASTTAVSFFTPQQLRRRLGAAHALRVLDVADGRASDRFVQHGCEVRHIPFGELPQRLDELRGWRDDDVVTVCPFGLRSNKAAKLLAGAGFERVWNLKGGLGAWDKVAPDTMTDPGFALRSKYALVGRYYDLLDYPFERLVYRKWRPRLLEDVRGEVLEAGVGTGHNLAYYHPSVQLTGVDLSPVMLQRARAKAQRAACSVDLRVADVTVMEGIESSRFDWLFSTFMCCVMPDEVQPAALAEFGRVLKPGGRFRLLEVVWSRDPSIRKKQERVAWLMERLYGARFDRQTLAHLDKEPTLEVTSTRFLKWESYLVIDGVRTA